MTVASTPHSIITLKQDQRLKSMYLHNTIQNIKQYHLAINKLLPVLILKIK